MDCVPEITSDDIDRLVNRDFAGDDRQPAFAILGEFTHNDAVLVRRVRAAMLKLSEGNLDRLQSQLKEANFDWRDLLCAAEYPESWLAHCKRWSMGEQEHFQARDWQQYQEWLRR